MCMLYMPLYIVNLCVYTTWYIVNLRVYTTWYIVNLRVYMTWYIVNLRIYFSFFILCSLIIISVLVQSYTSTQAASCRRLQPSLILQLLLERSYNPLSSYTS